MLLASTKLKVNEMLGSSLLLNQPTILAILIGFENTDSIPQRAGLFTKI